MSQDLDYQPDVLKFKQVWGNTSDPKIKQTSYKTTYNNIQKNKQQPDPKNLQTIESNTKRKSQPRHIKEKKKENNSCTHNHVNEENKIKHYESMKKPNKNVDKSKTVFSSSNVKNLPKTALRNPRPEKPQQVIQVTTQPKQFNLSSQAQTQKLPIYQSHLTIAHQSHHSHHAPFNKDSYNQTSTSMNKFYPPHMNHHDLKSQLSSKDYQLSLLRVTNSKNQDRIRYLQQLVHQRDQQILRLKSKHRQFIHKNSQLQSKQLNFDYNKVQYQNYKNDSRRLLKMLQSTQEYKVFAELAMDDNGVRFLHHVNKEKKGKLDVMKGDGKGNNNGMVHFCTCNKAFIPQSSFWVPEKVYSFGREFVKKLQGEKISESQLELMLYELNKLWRQREKNIINSLQALKGHQVGKYKRKLKNMTYTERQKNNRNKKSNSTMERPRSKIQERDQEQQENSGVQQ